MHSHLGISYRVWRRRESWFWLVHNQPHSGATIGTAATEAEAIADACSSIEERPVQFPSSSSVPRRTSANTLMPTRSNAVAYSWLDWWICAAHRATTRMQIGPAYHIARSS